VANRVKLQQGNAQLRGEPGGQPRLPRSRGPYYRDSTHATNLSGDDNRRRRLLSWVFSAGDEPTDLTERTAVPGDQGEGAVGLLLRYWDASGLGAVTREGSQFVALAALSKRNIGTRFHLWYRVAVPVGRGSRMISMMKPASSKATA
jgi:hypothetical protein